MHLAAETYSAHQINSAFALDHKVIVLIALILLPVGYHAYYTCAQEHDE